MARHKGKRIAHVSTFPPLRCGIASFAADLISATVGFDHLRYGLHYGGVESTHWAGGADVNSVEELTSLARSISASDCAAVVLQHEFGIWGGSEGENIHAFLDNLAKPFIPVLHTTFKPGDKRGSTQTDVVLRLVRESVVVVALTVASKQSVEELAGGAIDRLVVLPHGVPDYLYVLPPPRWSNERHGGGHPLRMITPGYFRPGKGFEVVLGAARRLRERGYSILYVIAGESQRQFSQQESYRAQVERLVDTLELNQEVYIDARYLSLDEQATAIRGAHVGIFGYQDRIHASSGTVPLVMSMGRPVICTPFEYATTKADEVPGVFLAPGFDETALAYAIEQFIQMDAYEAVAEATYSRTRSWLWTVVGERFAELLSTSPLC